jgi:hypothetical protein
MMAPEIIREGKRHRAGLGLGDGYGKEVDMWAWAILTFEMANVCLSFTLFLWTRLFPVCNHITYRDWCLLDI